MLGAGQRRPAGVSDCVTAGVLLGLVLAQSAPADVGAQPDLQRIRKALQEPVPATISAPAVRREGTMFRLNVEALDLGKAWEDRSIVPAYVRPWFRGYQHAHLEQVTPEQFRGATLHPYGFPIDAIVGYLVKEIKAIRRAAGEKRASQEVRAALEAFLACRADPAKPGCAESPRKH